MTPGFGCFWPLPRPFFLADFFALAGFRVLALTLTLAALRGLVFFTALGLPFFFFFILSSFLEHSLAIGPGFGFHLNRRMGNAKSIFQRQPDPLKDFVLMRHFLCAQQHMPGQSVQMR